MPSTVAELPENRVKLTVHVSAEELKPHLDKAYREIAKQVQIPGFRKGKVPPAVINQRFGKATVLQEAINEIIPAAYAKALDEHKITPLGQPEIDIAEMGDDVTFTAEVDRTPDFELPEISEEIKICVAPKGSVVDGVAKRIETLRERMATTIEVDRAAAAGDMVVVNLRASKDGEDLEDASAENASFKLGSQAMLEGMNEAVIGLSAGESAEFKSTLVGGKYKGTECDIAVTVVKVQEHKLPEVNDAFAQLVSKFDTVAEMEADLQAAVEQTVAMEQISEAQDKALEELVKKTDLDFPAKTLAAEIAARRENVKQQLAQARMSVSDYLELLDDVETEEEFWAKIDKETEVSLKSSLILDKVVAAREITVEQHDFSEYLYRAAQAHGTTPQQEAQLVIENNQLPHIAEEIRRLKALKALLLDITVTDTDGNKVDMTLLNPPIPEAGISEEAAAEAADETAETSAE